MAPRETENNAYTKIWGDKEHYDMLWYFLEWSIEAHFLYCCSVWDGLS